MQGGPACGGFIQRLCTTIELTGILHRPGVLRFEHIMRAGLFLRTADRRGPSLPVIGVDLRVLFHARQRHVGRLKADQRFPAPFHAFECDGERFAGPLRAVGGDGVGKVDVALRFIGLRVQCAGGFTVRQRDTVTRDRFHLPHAVGDVTPLRVAFAEAHPVTL